MIKELVQFTNSLDAEMKAIGIKPKDGLHILFHYQNDVGNISISEDFQYEIFRSKEI